MRCHCHMQLAETECIHDIFGILWLLPVLQIVQITNESPIIHVSGLCEVCRSSTILLWESHGNPLIENMPILLLVPCFKHAIYITVTIQNFITFAARNMEASEGAHAVDTGDWPKHL